MKTVETIGGAFRVRFDGPDFSAALKAVRALPTDQRTFSPLLKAWTVAINPFNRSALEAAGFEFKAEAPAIPAEIPPQVPAIPAAAPSAPTDWTQLRIPEKRLKGLFPYQVEGVRFLESRGGRGIVGDDMGLGKTVQAIGWAMIHPEVRPLLVVCPASIKINWQREIYKWCGEVAEILQGRDSYRLRPAKWFIINYDILAQEDPIFKAEERQRLELAEKQGQRTRKREIPLVGWKDELIKVGVAGIILDEAHRLANPTTLRTRAVFAMAAGLTVRILLSGTPVQNYAAGFWSLLHLVSPRAFPSYYRYLWRYCDPRKGFKGHMEFKGLTNWEELRGLIAPLMIRRRKLEVLKDLPPKFKIVLPLDLDEVEAHAYKSAEADFIEWVRENIQSREEGKTHIDHLKQLAYLAKRNSLMDWIQTIVDSGEKLILFAFHLHVISDICANFKAEAMFIDGSIPAMSRQPLVDQFQADPRRKVLVIQMGAGGEGLNITAASVVGFVEFGWNPWAHNQCEDRAWRYGNVGDKVLVYYLTAAGTVEDDIVALINGKYGQGRVLLGDSATLEASPDFFEGGMVDSLMKDYADGEFYR